MRLRPIALDDVEALVSAAENDSSSFAPPGEEGRERLRRQIERNPTLADGGFFALAVEGDCVLIGDVQARAPQGGFPPGVCEIGITLFPEAQGRGFGREAVALFTDHLLAAGLARVQATTAVGNVAMRRVLEHLGFRLEGELRDYGPAADGGREDYAMYAATRAERPGPA